MDDLRKAAQMALDALVEWKKQAPQYWDGFDVKAVKALRQALAQPEQVSIEPPDYVEPVTYDYHEGWEKGFKDGVESVKNKKESTPSNVDPLLHGGDGNYIKQAQPEQDPVCTKIEGNQFETFKVRYEDAVKLKDLPVGTKLYTAPPSKPWIGLDDKDFQYQVPHDVITMKYAEAILKEKNT